MAMRNFTLLLFSLFLMPLFLLAQTTTLTVKVQGGKSWQNYGDDFRINGYDQKIDHYGMSAELFRSVTPHIFIGVAPGYMRRGAACEPGFIVGDLADPFFFIDATIYLDYIQLPFLLKLTYPIIGRLEAFGQTGAGFSYLAGGFRDITTGFNTTTTERRTLDFSGADSNLNRFDFGWNSALGFAYRIGAGKLKASGEYYHSFIDINQNNTSQNRNWGIALGYQIPLSSPNQ